VTAAIAGLGAYYPERVRTNAEWPADFAAALRSTGDRLFNDIPPSPDAALRLTDGYLAAEAGDAFLGVRERRVAPEAMSSADAELIAAQRALADAGTSAEAVDAVISYAAVPDRMTPASACSVAHRLGASRAIAYGVDAACATALVQIELARALVESGQASTVLLTQSHLLLRAFPMLHPAAPGLGDAATAVVVRSEGRFPILATLGRTHGQFAPAVTWVRGDTDADDAPWWQTGGPLRIGSRDRAQAKLLQRDTVAYGAQTLRELAQAARIDLERIDVLASVEPRGWVPLAIAEVLGLDPAIVASVYETRGHLGACGPIANLTFAYASGKTQGARLLALYAQGAGFTRAAVLLGGDGRVPRRDVDVEQRTSQPSPPSSRAE
jgi:3-oxoacyl-[acyl-carrier-protein] synthase III